MPSFRISGGQAVLLRLATLITNLDVLAAAAQTVKVDQYPLRSGCLESRSGVVAKLHAGEPVTVKFSLAGGTQPCFVVSAIVDGKDRRGQPARQRALTGIDEFVELRARRDAAPVGAPAIGGRARAPLRPLPLSLPAVKSSNPEIERAVQLLGQNQPDHKFLDILQKVLRSETPPIPNC